MIGSSLCTIRLAAFCVISFTATLPLLLPPDRELFGMCSLTDDWPGNPNTL